MRVVCAFDPDTGAELARLSSTIQPNVAQLSDAQMIYASRPEFVRLHSLTQEDADRARFEVHDDNSSDLVNDQISPSEDNCNAAS